MKRLILFTLLLISVLTVLSSCSRSGEPRKVERKDNANDLVILRGKSLRTGTISPIKTTNELNIYAVGDTVWASLINGVINPQYGADVRASSKNGNFQAYRIEETPLVMDSADQAKIKRTLDKLNGLNWEEKK